MVSYFSTNLAAQVRFPKARNLDLDISPDSIMLHHFLFELRAGRALRVASSSSSSELEDEKSFDV